MGTAGGYGIAAVRITKTHKTYLLCDEVTENEVLIMATLTGDNGNFLRIDNFISHKPSYELSATLSFDIGVKAGSFSGCATIYNSLADVCGLCENLTEICRTYTGSTHIETTDPDYEYWDGCNRLEFEISRNGYLLVRGQLFEIVQFDNPQSEFVNKLDFAFKTPVGNVDLFLQELRFEVEGFSE